MTDWRRLLVYTHRWLGLAGCLLFIAWFASGVVMMYVRMPSLTAEERLLHAGRLATARVHVTPAAAARTAGLTPRRIRLGMLGTRPVYRLTDGREARVVMADSGEPAPPVDATSALALAQPFARASAGVPRHEVVLTDRDQWTLSSSLRPYFPLHRIALGDADGTVVYLSARTGDAVMKTTRSARAWNTVGSVLHWLYFTPLRRQGSLWTQTVIWLSIAGCIMTASGLLWGLWRVGWRTAYRLRGQSTRLPYDGAMRWHHAAGLLFGLTTFTWIFSGLLSMTPWDWSPGHTPTRGQQEALAGGPLRLDGWTPDHLRNALARIPAEFPTAEVEFTQFQGAPHLLAHRLPDAAEDRRWANTDAAAFLTPGPASPHLLVPDDDTASARTAFSREALESAARHALPGATPVDLAWLEHGDTYYYDRTGTLPLPVLRVRYDDADRTWLYVDPGRGEVVRREGSRSRLERWLYHGLHSFDLPWLYTRRPLWDGLLIALSLGGIASTLTALPAGWRRLRRHKDRITASS